jgi:probable rRNA maturation factor
VIEVVVSQAAWTRALRTARAVVREAAMAAGPPGNLTIVLSDDAELTRLNARFRGKPTATNVLAFPAGLNAEGHLGDIVIALETCEREASAQRKALADHLRHLVVHGVLHLMGYDHQTDDQADRMETLETNVLAGLGVSDPYMRRAPAG